MKKIIFLLVCLIFCWSCSKKPRSNANNSQAQVQSIATMNIDTSKCLIIKNKAGVIKQARDTTTRSDGDSYVDEAADDASFYDATAWGILDSNHIQTIFTDKKCLYFINGRGDTFRIGQEVLDSVNMILFNGTDKPFPTFTINMGFDNSLRRYLHIAEIK